VTLTGDASAADGAAIAGPALPAADGRAEPEPVSAEPPPLPGRALMSQKWLSATFLHWPVAPEAVRPFLPRGVRPDLYQGTTYIGLIAFQMYRIGWMGLPGMPYIGTFPETNVRLYSVDERGRRGVVFRSLDATRLLPVATARLAFRLPYRFAKMGIERDGDVIRYRGERREIGAPPAHSTLGVRIGTRIEEPSDFEHFVSARWRLHFPWFGGLSLQMQNEHEPWPLFRAELLDLDQTLVAAAGFPEISEPPVSVLYSPGVAVRFGRPTVTKPGGRSDT
jgi:uncharacterized protein YqjF (DUF2071 family)